MFRTQTIPELSKDRAVGIRFPLAKRAANSIALGPYLAMAALSQVS